MEKTTLYLDATLHRQIRELAQRYGRPQAELMREALERYVQAQERPVPRSVGAGRDGTVGARDSEAWLRTEWAKREQRPDR
jgi:predicted transcriptional regulator